jgi:hypothetical protein
MVSIAERSQPLQVTGQAALDTNKDLASILALEASVLHQVSLGLPQGGDLGTVWVRLTRTEGGFDEVSIDDITKVKFAAAAHIVAATREQFKPYDTSGKIEVIVGEQLAEFYKIREETLQRLESLNEKLIKDGAEYRRRVDEETAAFKARLQEESKAEREQQAAELQVKLEGLQCREEELASEKKALDDRSSRHARRQHHKDLKKALQDRSERFSLTEETIKKRWPVHVLFVVLVVAAGCLLGTLLWGEVRSGDFSWYLLARVSVAMAAFGAAIVYYIRWNDQWFRQHADEEFRLKRLDLDIDRASWVVEMAMEWKEERGTAIPAELIDRLTRNLFQDVERRKAVRHPSQDLASLLLGASTALRVRIPGGGEARLDRRGVRTLKREARGLEDDDGDR